MIQTQETTGEAIQQKNHLEYILLYNIVGHVQQTSKTLRTNMLDLAR